MKTFQCISLGPQCRCKKQSVNKERNSYVKQQQSWKNSGQIEASRRTDQPACARWNWDIRGLEGVFRWDLKAQMGEAGSTTVPSPLVWCEKLHHQQIWEIRRLNTNEQGQWCKPRPVWWEWKCWNTAVTVFQALQAFWHSLMFLSQVFL